MSWPTFKATPTAAAFLVLFPEFAQAGTAMIDSRIAMALERTPEDIWGDLQAQGLAYLTAEFLSLSPNARDLRLEGGADSIYARERKRLEIVVSSGFRVAGLPETYTAE